MTFARRFLPSISELVAFEASARLGSFTRAAEELGLTQGAVSKQVRQLELSLGTVLFDRARHRITLRSAGRSYINEVREMLERMERSAHSVMATGGSEAVINFAVLPTFATKWLVGRLPRFAERHPGVTINFTSRTGRFSFDEEPYDVAIQRGPPLWPGATPTYLFHERFVPVTSPAYRDLHGLAAPEDLLRAVLIQQSTRPRQWYDWFVSVGVPFDGTFRGPLFDQFTMIAQAAACGLGVALVPRFLAEDELVSGKLVVLFNQELPGEYAYYYFVPTAKRGNPLIEALGDWLVSEADTTPNVLRRAGDGGESRLPSA